MLEQGPHPNIHYSKPHRNADRKQVKPSITKVKQSLTGKIFSLLEKDPISGFHILYQMYSQAKGKGKGWRGGRVTYSGNLQYLD